MKVSAKRVDCWLNEAEETNKQNATYKPHFLEKSVLFVAKTQSLTAAYLSADYVFVFVSMLRQILREKKMFVHILDCVRYRFISDINTRNCHTRENAAQFAAALLQASAICTQNL